MDKNVKKYEPLFSIVMPVHNTPSELLNRALQSVVNQIYDNWELVIVDDGSSPPVKIPRPLQKINIFRTPHRGVSHARNFGIQLCSGEYICLLDSDDEYTKDHLQTLFSEIDSLKYPVGIFKTGIIHYMYDSAFYSTVYQSSKYANSIHYLLSESHFSPSSLCFSKSIVNKVRFPLEYKYFEDTHFLVSALLQYPFYSIPTYTCHVYAHSLQASARMYTDDNYRQNLSNNIDAIRALFSLHGEELTKFLPKDFQSNLLSEKFLQHANGLLMAGRRSQSIKSFMNSVKHSRGMTNTGLYLKYIVKFIFPFLMRNRF